MENNELEFEPIYATFQPKIYRYLTRLVGGKDAEDLTQDVFIKVANGLAAFKNQSQLSTWIYQIATNTAIDRMKSRSFKQETNEVQSLKEVNLSEKNAFKQPSSIEEQVVHKEMTECIQKYIARLPESYRTILILSEIEGFKNSEIAVVLGLSAGVTKIRLHRAKERLKELLKGNCNFYYTSCGKLACEPKEPIIKKFKPLTSKKR